VEDAFGSHERLASALAKILSEEPGGKAIALEGGWGSGKSTVINLVKHALSENPNHSLLVFDAWAHEGDPLRRTFLENLIDHLRNWISDKEEWDNRRRELSRRRKVTHEKSVPNLTTFGKLLTITTFLVPLGFALLNSALREGASLVPFQSSEPAWDLIVGFVLTLAPLWLFAGNYALLRVRRRFGSRKPTEAEDVALNWGLLFKGKVEEKKTETIETPNPTSVEFESIFTSLLDDALRKDDRKLIIVLDNLDRVSSRDALSIWSTLGTFLDLTRKSSRPWSDRLWILVPYDPGSIKRLWNHKAQDQHREHEGDTEKSLPDNARAPSFLDKAFQLRLVVPPLVLSNWHDYLLELLAQALPQEEEQHFHSVYRVFAVHVSDQTPPTPRDLKLYVNGITGVYRQWGSAIPLPDAAYYVLLTRDGLSSAEIARQLRTAQLPPPNLQTLLTPSIRDNLAVLLFNVEPSKARQLLLEEELLKVLQKPDPEKLADLAQGPGFWEVLETLDFRPLAKKEADKIANSARCLHDSGVVSQMHSQLVSTMCTTTLKNLRVAAVAVESWAPFGENIGNGLAALCSLIPETAFAKQLVAILTSVQGGAKSETEKQTALRWFETTFALVGGLSTLNMSEVLDGGIPISGDPATALTILDALHTKDPEGSYWSSYRLETGAAEIVTTLAGSATDNTFTESQLRAVAVLQVLDAVENWTPLLEAVKTHLGAPSSLSDTQTYVFLRLLWQLRSSGNEADALLAEIATTGHLMHHLHPLVRGKSSEAIRGRAWCVYLQLLYVPEKTTVPAVGNSAHGIKYLTGLMTGPQNDEKTVAQLSELFSRYGDVDHLFELVRKEPSAKPLLAACVAAAKIRNCIPTLIPQTALLKNWDVMRHEELFPDVIDTIIQNTDIQSGIMSGDFNRADCGLYAALVHTGHSEAAFKGWCVSGLKGIDLKGWQQELQDEDNAADLLVELVDAGVELELDQEYQDAIVEHGKAMIAGKPAPTYLKDYWDRLLVPLKGDRRKMVQRHLYDAAGNAAGKIAPAFFDLYGQEIMDTDTLSRDDRAVVSLFTPLLTQRNVRGLRWLQECLAKNPDFLQRHRAQETVADFRERVTRMFGKPGEEDKPLQDAIAVLALELKIDREDVGHENSGEVSGNE
jgi:hypothetical protein